MYEEKITIWSNPKLSKQSDIDTIKHEFAKKGKNITITACKLLKDMEDVKVYNIKYYFEDLNNSKEKVK